MTIDRAAVAKVGLIRDPAVAVAAGKCWLFRWSKRTNIGLIPRVNETHPSECGFCDYDMDQLAEALKEFGEWAGLTTDGEKPFRSDVEAFLMLDPEQQRAEVAEAQYGE